MSTEKELEVKTPEEMQNAIIGILGARLPQDYKAIVPMTHAQIAHLIVASSESVCIGVDYVSLVVPDSFPQCFPFRFSFDFGVDYGSAEAKETALQRGISLLELVTGKKARKATNKPTRKPTAKPAVTRAHKPNLLAEVARRKLEELRAKHPHLAQPQPKRKKTTRKR